MRVSETPWRLSWRMPSRSKPARPRAPASCSRAMVRANSSQNQGWMPDSAASEAGDSPARMRPSSASRRSHLGIRMSPSLRARAVELARAERLAQRLAEVAADAHRLADRLHLRGQGAVGARELLEGEARSLHDDVVDRRLERGGRRAGDVVRDLVERVADREPGRRPWRSGTPSPSRRARSCARRAGSSRSRRARRSRGSARTGRSSRRSRRRRRGSPRPPRRAASGTRGRRASSTAPRRSSRPCARPSDRCSRSSR